MFINLFNRNKPNNHISPVMLLVLDGWGIAPPGPGNAISLANPENINNLYSRYPSGSLIASGESVGLPANEVGNTEVGHLTMGTGRVVYQDLVRINNAIKNESFFVNPALVSMEQHIKKHNSRFHVLGLVGMGNVHSSAEHMYAVIDYCKRKEINSLYLHLFTDGRDSDPKSGLGVIKNIEQYLKSRGVGKIATVSGRYYAMDRDRRWERTKLAYDAIVNAKGVVANSAVEGVERSYAAGKTDEFIEPLVVQTSEDNKNGFIADNDAIFLFNFRVDRPRQIASALTMPDFESSPATHPAFKRERWPKNLFSVTMTEYDRKIPVNGIVFRPQIVNDSLPAVISQAGFSQLHMAESEKERFVTYYFRGMHEDPYPKEDVIIIPSPKVPTYDKKPEMSLPGLVKEVRKQIGKGKYHFIVMNVASPDMVAHSGNIEASVKACKFVDKGVAEIADAIFENNGTLIVTADHGNIEQMLSFSKSSFFVTTGEGKVITDHTNNPVPVIIARKGMEGQMVGQLKGGLSDLAPTVLALMGLVPSKGMTGKNLLNLKNHAK